MSSQRAITLLLFNGQVITLGRPSRAEALAISGDRIAAVGSSAQVATLAGEETEVVDLQGRAVLPGFIDAHTHLVSTGLVETIYLDLAEARSLEELLELVRAAAHRRAQGEWLISRRWDETYWPEKRYIERRDLDRVAPDHPAALFRVDGHLLSVNSKALELVKLPGELAGCADLERGLLWEEAAWWFHEQLEPEQEELERAILAGARLAHSLGITSVHDIVKPGHVRAYQALGARGQLKLRVYLNPRGEAASLLMEAGLRTGFGDEWLCLGGVKLFADGSIGAGNAALSEPYLDREGRGKLNYDDEELFRVVEEAYEQGWQVLTHAIGDRAIEQVLWAYERAGVRPEDRWRIEHFELANDEQLERAARLGLVASMQPNFLKWAKPGDMYEARLGRERTSRIGPHRLALDSGLKLAFGSDCMPLGPLFGVHQAVNAPYPAQRLTVEEAIRCYTLGGAYASFEEGSKGSLEPGKLADLVVLSEDPFEEPSRIGEIKVEMTFAGGELVFARSGVDNRSQAR
ncbi:MAG: amidohydrolase [Candidatus Acetothermia bacterium]|nr:amidohydrolase [Candidatus Acetothermia bacterium]MDH7505875.1 amidohydrolase [Candidatus Acetothermia bacterium]